jgi:phosphohistidine phosphatase
MGVEFDLVLVSPKARARETAELASEAWGAATRGVIRVHPLLAEDFDAAEARVALDQLEEDACLLLVGHEPDMSRLVGDLAGGSVDMKKGGVAALRLEGARGELLALLRPRDLALVAAVPP